MNPLDTPSRPTLAHQEAVRLPFPEVVQRLREILGNRLVAYIGGVKETRAVRQWAEGEGRTPSDIVQQRLRHALLAASMIAAADDASVVQAWFQGANPKLGFTAPARLLRDGDEQQQAWSEVIAAANAFVVGA